MKRALTLTTAAFCAAAPMAAQESDDEDGGGFLTRTIEDALSGAGRDVQLIGFAGALSSEATFERMTIADDQGIWLTLEDVALNWRRAALLRGRLEVNSLTAGSLEITRLPDPGEEPAELPPAEAQEFSLQLPELPVSVNIANFDVAAISLGEPIIGVPVDLSLSAAARLDDEGLFLTLAANRTDDVQGAFNVKTDVLRDGGQIEIDVSLDEAEGGIAARLLNLPGLPSVDLAVAGIGPLDNFAAELGLSTSGEQRLGGQVILSAEQGADPNLGPDRRIQADLGGNITPLILPEYQSFFGPDVGLRTNTLLRADGAIDVETFELAAQSIDLAGTVALNKDLWPSFVDVRGEISQDGAPAVLPGSDAGLTVTDVTLDVSFDAAQGDALNGAFVIRDITHAQAQIERVALDLDGVLDGSVDAVGRLLADITVAADGLTLQDDGLREALGERVRAGARVNYVEDAPIEITGVTLSGVDYGLTGDFVIQGLDDGFPTDLEIEVAAQDISRFAALAGQPLSGAADLSVAGSITPLSSMFDLVISGTTQNIVVSIPEVDNLLRGRTDLSLAAARNTDGTFVRDLTLENEALEATADVSLRTNASDVQADVLLRDLALVYPQVEGPVSLTATASQDAQGWWTIDTDLQAPQSARASVKGLATGEDASLDFNVSMPDVSAYVPEVPGALLASGRVWQSQGGYEVDVRASGPYDAAVEVAGLATGPDARLDVSARLADMGALLPELSGALQVTGEVAKAGADWAVDSRLEGPANMAAAISGTVLADASAVDLALNGQVPTSLAVPFIAPATVSGPASFDLTVDGPPGLAAVRGRITTSDVRFSEPNARIALQDITSQIDIADSRARLDVAAALATGGRAEVGGSIDLTSLAGDITVGLINAEIVDPTLYAATVNADVNVNGPLTGGATISGEVNLEEVNVTVPGTGVTSIGSIPEIRHVGASSAVTATRERAGVIPKQAAGAASGGGPVYGLNLDINAPSKIFIRGRGLNAEVGGDLQLRGTTANVVSSGGFDLIRGRFDLIGKRFDLDEGTVQFQGSLTPFIRFVTTTEVPDGTASIIVEGLASEPEISFTSDPEVPEDEVLSLILFGRYVSELSAFQALELANGAAQLTGRGGINVLGNIRGATGLDDLDVTTDSEGRTSVSAGKYITDTIYTDVTTNSEDGTDISLNIDLTDNLTGKATVAEDGNSGVGLFFQRDY